VVRAWQAASIALLAITWSSFVQGFGHVHVETSTARPQADYESASARDDVVGVGQNYIDIDVTTLAGFESALNLRSHGRFDCAAGRDTPVRRSLVLNSRASDDGVGPGTSSTRGHDGRAGARNFGYTVDDGGVDVAVVVDVLWLGAPHDRANRAVIA
jgi:hypothetical protein